MIKIQDCFAGGAQTLPDEAPPIGKIHPFRKIAVTFEPKRDFDALQDLYSLIKRQYSFFFDWKHHFNRFGVTAL